MLKFTHSQMSELMAKINVDISFLDNQNEKQEFYILHKVSRSKGYVLAMSHRTGLFYQIKIYECGYSRLLNAIAEMGFYNRDSEHYKNYTNYLKQL